MRELNFCTTRCSSDVLHSNVLYAINFFFNDTATPEIYTLSLHDALPICRKKSSPVCWTKRDWMETECPLTPINPTRLPEIGRAHV